MTDVRGLNRSTLFPHPILAVLLLLFVGSGCAALVYEIVWFQMLQMVIGSTAISLAVLLGTFMGGMCLGSLLLPRVISPSRHPLRVYATLEFCIGLIGIIELHAIPLVSRIYTASIAPGMSGLMLRGAVACICLVPPTMLMGATLPAIARWVRATPRGVSWLGFFYAGNTIGAVIGCLGAGFYLLRNYDVSITTYCAAAINVFVAALALGLSPFAAKDPLENQPEEPESGMLEFPDKVPGVSMVYLVIALSGASALGAEVIWTRLLSLLLGGTVYTFSIILAVLLLGLVIGSSVGSLVARVSKNPRMALGWTQVLLACAIAWAAHAITGSLPNWPITPRSASDPTYLFEVDLMRCMWAIIPATCLWGASFPIALAAAAGRNNDPGKLVGGVYASNTLGAILGALLFSLIAVPIFGTDHAEKALIAIAALSGLIALNQRLISIRLPVTTLAGVSVLTFGLWRAVVPLPWQLVAYGRDIGDYNYAKAALYVGEGMNNTVAVTVDNNDAMYFNVAGKCEASTIPADMRLQMMLGHIPAMLHPNPKSVLVVGCGAGVTAGTFTTYPEISNITICEIEPLVPEKITPYFHVQNEEILTCPRLTLVLDDARHFVLTTHQKFDIITSDPIHPWVKGAACLYTKDYFQMVKAHLNPGGLVTQWVPLYETDEKSVKDEVATFLSVFPNGSVWANDTDGAGYDVVMLGSADDNMHLDVDAIQQRMEDSMHQRAVAALETVQFHSAGDLLQTYCAQGSDLSDWLSDAQINTDQNLRLQYEAGMANNLQIADTIYHDMLRYRRFHGEIFVGEGEAINQFRQSMMQP